MALAMIKLPVQTITHRIVTETWNVDFPAVYGLSDLSIQQKINFDIFRAVHLLARALTQPDMVTYISMSYEIKTNERGILSLTLHGLGDFHGAHPVSMAKSLTFDIETGKLYSLGDLFKPDSDYVKVLSDMVGEQIKEREIPLVDGYNGISPNQDYYLADVNMIIYFQPYVITPGAYGFPYFTIPIYSIQELIPENGLLLRLSSF